MLLTKEPVVLSPLVPTPANNSWSLAMIYFYTVLASITAIPAIALRRGKGAVKALKKDLWLCVLLRSSYWSLRGKKENPCVWYSWSMNIFNTFVKQGNGEVSTERQNAAAPTQPSTVCALPCFHPAKFCGGAGCHVSYKFHSTCGTQFSRDWDVTSATLPPLTDPQVSTELTIGVYHWTKERYWISRRLRN